jgi:hypothetical protein
MASSNDRSPIGIWPILGWAVALLVTVVAGLPDWLVYLGIRKEELPTVLSPLAKARPILWCVAAGIVVALASRPSLMAYGRTMRGLRRWLDVARARLEIRRRPTHVSWLWLAEPLPGVEPHEERNAQGQRTRRLSSAPWRGARAFRSFEIAVRFLPAVRRLPLRAGVEVTSTAGQVCEFNVGTDGAIWSRYPDGTAQPSPFLVNPYEWTTFRLTRPGASQWSIRANGGELAASLLPDTPRTEWPEALEVRLVVVGLEDTPLHAIFSEPRVR